MSLVAVDQANYSVDANISSSLASADGRFGEGQQTQKVNGNCTDLTFNVFSPDDSETITLLYYADGPCESFTHSIQHVNIHFLNCTCPVGFEPSNGNSTRGECICDSALSPYITNCNYVANQFTCESEHQLMDHLHQLATCTDTPGYVIHPNCL